MKSETGVNQPKYYVLTYLDGRPAKVVYGWPAVIAERKYVASKISAKGFHTKEVAERYRKNLIIGSVSFETEKPQLL